VESRVDVAGVSISHPRRVLFPADEITKLDLARYYEAMAPAMLPHVAGRPLTLVRCAESIADCVYMRHTRAWKHWPALRIIRVPERKKTGEYFVADSAAALVSLMQMDIIEIHTWNSTAGHLEQPDRVVFDLDPGEGVSWRRLADGARLLRDTLEALGLKSWLKTTGGIGLHVVVPLVPAAGWPECLQLTRTIAMHLAAKYPDAFTASVAKPLRRGRIYLDYLRNNRGNSSVAAFSVRAHDGAPVSVPIGWDELARRPRFTMRNVLDRRDPWRGYWRARQTLPSQESAHP
jgi:bifunctional non-homologous end joining protein LigD